MKLVTLTTDWGTSDFFAGMVKGRLYSLIPDVQVVDITHDIESYNLVKAAFILKNSCFNFPEGTIHIIDVDTYENKDCPYLVVECEKQYYICADNGIPTSLFRNKQVNITQISMFQDSSFYTFPAYNLFCLVAARLAEGVPMEEIGFAGSKLKTVACMKPLVHNDWIEADVMYVDSYGNAYLNILYDDFAKILNGRRMWITIGVLVHKEVTISDSYFDTIDYGEYGFALTVSATGYLELALLHASAEELLGATLGQKVIIQFS
ncbi:MAG: SAM-dependent chlorinase/fluorinase [Bacteroidales bacterium]|nr:SAM-dependent chlorinase/fluorinase [Bacteroidales bacterium]